MPKKTAPAVPVSTHLQTFAPIFTLRDENAEYGIMTAPILWRAAKTAAQPTTLVNKGGATGRHTSAATAKHNVSADRAPSTAG